MLCYAMLCCAAARVPYAISHVGEPPHSLVSRYPFPSYPAMFVRFISADRLLYRCFRAHRIFRLPVCSTHPRVQLYHISHPMQRRRNVPLVTSHLVHHHQPTRVPISPHPNPDPAPCLIKQTTAMRITIIRRHIDVLIRMLRHTEIRRRKHRINDTSRRSSGHGRDRLRRLRLLHASIARGARRGHTARIVIRQLRRAGRVTAM